jgi:hypothetical protein
MLGFVSFNSLLGDVILLRHLFLRRKLRHRAPKMSLGRVGMMRRLQQLDALGQRNLGGGGITPPFLKLRDAGIEKSSLDEATKGISAYTSGAITWAEEHANLVAKGLDLPILLPLGHGSRGAEPPDPGANTQPEISQEE